MLFYYFTDCGTLTVSNFTNVKSVTAGNTQFDESKTVECETGYRLRNNNNNSVVSSVLKCEATGKWTVFAGCEKKGNALFAFIYHSVCPSFHPYIHQLFNHSFDYFLHLFIYSLWYLYYMLPLYV